MAKGRFPFVLSALVIAACVGATSPHAATKDECRDSPLDAVTILPEPLRKWAEIDCTPWGQTLGSRGGWIWASLDDARSVRIPSQMGRKELDEVGSDSYFTAIQVSELQPEDFAFALGAFNDGLDFTETSAKGYRVDLTSVSGGSMTVYFFDFETFAGAMWCPAGGCVRDSRFLILKQEHYTQPRPPSV